MAKKRFVEVYSQGATNVEKIIVDTQTGVNYLLGSSTLTAGCGMCVLVDRDGKPVVTPMEGDE
ncbi:MAG: xylan 1,4-beta-xylosidase [Oscillospiraceae bacterium]|nr:xylan 1,4-beta-xylosidase [Oscillospiraceae bacterium]